MKTKSILFLLLIIAVQAVSAADYKIDIKGMHAAVQFKISHLGTSWLYGRFDKFDGKFSYDAENPNDSSITMTVDTNSIDTNHAERDSHLRGKGFLETDQFPEASFVSESFDLNDKGGTVKGKFTLHGVTKDVEMAITKVGEGNDPWGGYRVGFEGLMTIRLADYGITRNLGKASETLDLTVAIEGIRQ